MKKPYDGWTQREVQDLHYWMDANHTRPSTILKYLKEHYHGGAKKMTIAAAVNIYRRNRQGSVSESTFYVEGSIFNKFTEHLGETLVGLVTPDQIDEFIGSVTNTPEHYNAVRKTLSGFFRWASGRSTNTTYPFHELLANRNPMERVHAKRVGRREKPLPAILTPYEMQSYIREAIKRNVGEWVVWGLLTGTRPMAETYRMWEDPAKAWGNIDEVNNQIKVYSSKTGKVRIIDISPTLKKWLPWLRKADWGPMKSRGRRMSVKAREKALLEARRASMPEDKALTKDLLRHTWFSYNYAILGSLEDLSLQGGNSVTVIKEHYFNRVTPHEAQGYKSMTPARFGIDRLDTGWIPVQSQ
jgi:integrase